MEKIFNQTLKNLTFFIGGKYAGYFALGITLSVILVLICQLIYSVSNSKKSNYSFNKFDFNQDKENMERSIVADFEEE